MPRITRHFLGWNAPVVGRVVAALCAGWDDGVLDLRDTLVVVPTRNAGRRLREALAEAAAARGSAVMPGLIVPPEYLISPKPPFAKPIATPVETLAVWTRLLLDLDLETFPALFPYNPEGFVQDSAWALSTAQRLVRLRSELAEGGLSVRGAATHWAACETFPEPERWEDLARLEELYLGRLRQLDKQDPDDAKIDAANRPRLPEEITQITVCAVADPLPLAVRALEKLAAELPVTVCIHAPDSEADAFDEWGRPATDEWQRTVVDIPDPQRNLMLAQRPENQAAAVAHLIGEGPVAPNDLAIGVPDSDILPFLEHELANAGWKTFDPAGTPLENHALARLTQAIVRFLQTPEYRQFATLARHPDFLEYMQTQDSAFNTAAALEQLDTIQNTHLPVSFADLAVHARAASPGGELTQICDAAESFRMRMKNGTRLSELVLDILKGIFAQRQLNATRPQDQAFQQAAQHISHAISEVDSEAVQKLGLPEDVIFGIIARRLQSLQYYPDRDKAAVDLQGWLELAWEDAPHLILTGMNEGRAPATVTSDPFLPDGARVILGLSSNERRFARDAYMLKAMIEARRDNGNTVFVVGKRSGQGDPLKPSRLLFLCSDDQLPERAGQLFAECGTETPNISREVSWRLNIPEVPVPDRIRVTQFRDYLTCPFRFYLTHVLGMEEKDDTKVELDALDFGTLCHTALEVLGDDELRGVTDPAAIEARLLARLDELTARQYGRNWPAPVYFQVEALRQRLRAAARYQLHAEGWEILETELSLGRNPAAIELAGMPIRGRIDRIDRHENGMIRILDYKTSESATPPERALWSTLREQTPEYARVTVNDKDRAWADLQLPLYVLLLRDRFDGCQIESGYFHLPKALSDTGVGAWTPTPDLLQSAEQCARGVIDDIRAGRFWPPSENVRYDDYERLFFGSPAECVSLNDSELSQTYCSKS